MYAEHNYYSVLLLFVSGAASNLWFLHNHRRATFSVAGTGHTTHASKVTTKSMCKESIKFK